MFGKRPFKHLFVLPLLFLALFLYSSAHFHSYQFCVTWCGALENDLSILLIKILFGTFRNHFSFSLVLSSPLTSWQTNIASTLLQNIYGFNFSHFFCSRRLARQNERLTAATSLISVETSSLQ